MSQNKNQNGQRSTKAAIRWVIVAVTLLSVGVAAGYLWAKRDRDNPTASTTGPKASDERPVLYWYDPMVPDQHFEKGGKSPFMDMQLVPRYADDTVDGGVRISPELQQSLGMRTAKVEIGRLSSTQRVPGTLAWNLRNETVVSARVEGQIDQLHVKAPYTRVTRGQALATLLSPVWASAVAEAEALQQVQSDAAQQLQSAARKRLRVLGANGKPAAGGSVTLNAPAAGMVTEVMAREGQAVSAGMPLFRINGTATLWLQAAIPQVDAASLHAGTPVKASVDALPGQTFDGEIELLLPQVDTVNRTQQARIVLNNPDGLLAPGMFAEVTLQADAGEARPLIPTEALIATGSDNRVIVVAENGGLQPLRVRVGRSDGGLTEVLEGLDGGEQVVTSGQFLIDSEASLSGLLTRLDSAAATGGQDGGGKPGNNVDLHQADATVQSIGDGKITLKHGPFETLHMPGMTMGFPLADPKLVEGIKAGDKVRVGVRSDADGLTVEQLDPSGEQP